MAEPALPGHAGPTLRGPVLRRGHADGRARGHDRAGQHHVGRAGRAALGVGGGRAGGGPGPAHGHVRAGAGGGRRRRALHGELWTRGHMGARHLRRPAV